MSPAQHTRNVAAVRSLLEHTTNAELLAKMLGLDEAFPPAEVQARRSPQLRPRPSYSKERLA